MSEGQNKDTSIANIFIFILITLVYFALAKPKITLEVLSNADEYKAFSKHSHYVMIFYFMLIVLIQFGFNTSTMINKCGGSATSNMASAAWSTFMPWVFIFGVMMGILIIFPGFKSAFSDVVGYFAVSKSATTLLSDLLVNTDIDNQVNDSDSKDTKESKKSMQESADAIVKLLGNVSILINQIVPGNFMHNWDTLVPLMKDKYKNNLQSQETLEKQRALLDIVVTRDNIGEGMWYLYTAILLISIVQFNISSTKCELNTSLQEEKYNEYLDKSKSKEKMKEAANSVAYKINSSV